MSVADTAALIGATSAAISALAAVATFVLTARRGSDRESRRSATVAIEVTADPTVTPIVPVERERGGA